MLPIDVEEFIEDNELIDINTFAIIRNKNFDIGDFYCDIIDIDSLESGYYNNGIIKEHIKLPVQFWNLLQIFECIIFDQGDLVMCETETWDGRQPSIILEKYYKTDYMKDIF
jgi:hypothetical protein